MTKMNIITDQEHCDMASDFAKTFGITVQSVDVKIDGGTTTSFDVDGNAEDIAAQFAEYFHAHAVPDTNKNYYDLRKSLFGNQGLGFQVGKGQYVMLKSGENGDFDVSIAKHEI